MVGKIILRIESWYSYFLEQKHIWIIKVLSHGRYTEVGVKDLREIEFIKGSPKAQIN